MQNGKLPPAGSQTHEPALRLLSICVRAVDVHRAVLQHEILQSKALLPSRRTTRPSSRRPSAELPPSSLVRCRIPPNPVRRLYPGLHLLLHRAARIFGVASVLCRHRGGGGGGGDGGGVRAVLAAGGGRRGGGGSVPRRLEALVSRPAARPGRRGAFRVRSARKPVGAAPFATQIYAFATTKS